jgi:VCBS repeat-containing protein
MGPYQSSGSFDSRIFDAGSTVSWDTLDWQAQTPTGTTLAMSVRAGDTATPDGSWSAWTPVASSGGHAGVVGRYAQYRADLSSTNPDSTPELDQVSLTTAAAPSNHPPVAAGDAYLTAKNTTLNQAAPGVLANDTDADSDPLTAHLDTNVAHGTLNLAAGGSFTYTPDNGYTGQDSFTYHANDGTADSNTVTVRLTVTTGTSLPPGSALTAGQSITSPNGVYRLTMQGDGNLVEYDRGSVVWAAGTDPTGASAVMQGDGNFVVYDGSNHALWASDTSGQAGATLLLGDTGVAVVSVDGATIWAPGTLSPGDRLLSGQSLLSPAGRYRLTMQGDGNLVEYNRTGTAVWASGTSTAGSRAVMQSDGNLVVYDGSNQPLWATNTSGHAGAYLRLQDTGQLTLESATGTALWAGPAELTADTSLTVGHSLNSPSGAFRLTLQSDGNLVEYDAGANVVWATGTSSGSKLIMQGDGNFVLYDAGDHALWASGTSGHAGATVTLLDTGQLVVAAPSGAPLWAGPGALLPDTRLNAGQSLSSPTGAYQLTMQVDGDLVLEHNSTVVWSSGTSSPGASALLQGDGNLVVYSSTSQALWATNTDGNPSSYLVLSDDGKLALLSPEGGTLWSAG